MTRNTDHFLSRSLFVDVEVPVEKEEGLQQKELEKNSHEAAEVESEVTDVGEKGGEDEEHKGDEKDEGAAKDEAGKKPALVHFVMWSQEEVDVEDSESSDFKVEDSKSQMGFLGEEADEKAVEETEMQLEEEKLDVGAKTDIRALFDSDSESDSDL